MKPSIGFAIVAVLFLALGIALYSGSLECTDRHIEVGAIKLGGC